MMKNTRSNGSRGLENEQIQDHMSQEESKVDDRNEFLQRDGISHYEEIGSLA